MDAAPSALRAHLDEHGFVVVPDVVPTEKLDAVVADIFRHLGADPRDRETWYKPELIVPAGMLEMYHYQSLWDTRQHPRVHHVFADILGTEKLWVSLDRASFKPPADARHPHFEHKGFIHWDTDTSLYPAIPFAVQGVLALTDTDESMGGFQCVPELYRDLGAWIARQPAGRNPYKPDLTGLTVTPVPLRAGDLVIWSTVLAHGNGHNRSDRPRLAQYITMEPARDDDETARLARIACWRDRIPPVHPAFHGDPRKIEEREGDVAHLTPLGRKLLGLDRWGTEAFN
jgi:ectoine hydroxylase-related dioxygenase (phytanoyl-CoA dioxygenase family)